MKHRNVKATHTQTWKTRGIPIKVALLEAGLFQREAAEMLGMQLSCFNMKLLGKRSFTPEERARLAEITGKPVEALFPTNHLTESAESTQDQKAVNS